MQATIAYHLHGWGRAEMTVQRQIGQQNLASYQRELVLEHVLNALKFRRQAVFRFRRVLAPFRTPHLALGLV